MDEVALMPAQPLTVVTVVFEAEVPLLGLQARSMRAHVAPGTFRRVIVIDNTRRGLSSRRRSSLLAAYGPWANHVRFVRPDELAAIPPTGGWTSQQILKLVVHQIIDTPHYLVLDAKNHWIEPTDPTSFVNPDGRARGACHSYRRHPLEPRIRAVFDYLGLDPEPWLDDFMVTHTPVVMRTELVSQLTTEIAERGEGSFIEQFITRGLVEFPLYAAWIIARFGGLDKHLDGTVVRSTTIWPSATPADYVEAVRTTQTVPSPFFAVHRTAIARAGVAQTRVLADFWVEHAIFESRGAAIAFIARFKLHYIRTMAVRKLVRDRRITPATPREVARQQRPS